jgi:nitroreductase
MLAVRSYLETPVPQELVRQIVEAGRLTGSAKNAQPWHFIVIENRDTLRQIGALARTGPYVAEAPLAIALSHGGPIKNAQLNAKYRRCGSPHAWLSGQLRGVQPS